MSILRGVEVLVKKASVDPAFRRLLLAERGKAALQIGLVLSPAEDAMLASVTEQQLSAIIDRTKVDPCHRMAFLGRTAAAMLLALGIIAGRPPVTPALIGARLSLIASSQGGIIGQADKVLEVQVQPEIKDGKATLLVKRVLKGQEKAKSIEMDFSRAKSRDQAADLEKLIKTSKGIQAVLVIGPADAYKEPSSGGLAFLHLNGTCFSLVEGKGGWDFEGINQDFLTIWNGGTDQLLRAVEYAQKDPDSVIPSFHWVNWEEPKQFDALGGKGGVAAAVPVDLACDGKLSLYVACDRGDKVYRYDAKAGKMMDVTGALGLSAKSLCVAFGDFTGRGRCDIASWDGATLTIYSRSTEGVYSAVGSLSKDKLGGEVLSLGVADGGKSGKVLIAAGERVMLHRPGIDLTVLGVDPALRKNLGEAKCCLSADFDGDGLADILHVFAKGSLLYKGKAEGGYADAKACEIAGGEGAISACLGDWDADGKPDVFVAGESCRLWQNMGDGKFTECLNQSGEISYKSAGAAAVAMGDINKDGWHDLLLLCSEDRPKLFLNCGFRSLTFDNRFEFGTENDKILPEAGAGQQAGCLADFAGRGSQQMALVLKDGKCVLVSPERDDYDVGGLQVAVSAKSGCAGPVTVEAMTEYRSLGVWSISAGGAGAFVAIPSPGAVTLKWQFPGQKPQTKKVILEGPKPRTLLLTPPEPQTTTTAKGA